MEIIKNIFNSCSRANAARDHIERDLIKQERRILFPELMTQSINNVRYLKAYINTLRGNIHCMKGNSAGETRQIRENAKSKLKWLELKLEEEIIHAHYYARLLGKTVNI